MRRRLAAAAVSALFVLAIAAPSLAAPDGEDAKPKLAELAQRHFRRGVELYDEADFATALVEFRRAYETLPEFRVLYNIGQAEYQLQLYAAALKSFRLYLDQGGERISASRRADVEREVARLEGRVARLHVSGPAGLEVFVDDEHVGQLPLPLPLVVSAGRRRLRTSEGPSGTRLSRTVEVAGGDDVRVDLGTEGSKAASTAPKSREPGQAPGPTVAPHVVTWVVTGGLAAGATVTGVLALGASSDLADRRARVPGTVTAAELEAAASKSKDLALATDLLGAAAIAGAGVSLYLTLRPRSPVPPVVVGLAGRSVSMHGRF